MYTSPFFHNHLLRCQKQNRKERITQVDYYHGHISNGRQSNRRILSETLFIAFLTLILVAQGSPAQPSLVFESRESANGNYTTNRSYRVNLNRILSNFTFGDVNGGGFYNFCYGQKSNRVHFIRLFRGDLESDSCRTCLNQSTHFLTQFCPNQKVAIGGFSEFILQYSNRSLLPRFYSWSDRNVSSNFTVGFFRDLRVLFEDLKNQAAIGGSLSKYAMGNYTGDREFDRSLYAIAQCTPDLSQFDCKNCLDEAFGDVLRQNGSVRVGGRVITPSCNFRYEVFPFYGNGNQSDASPESRLQSTPTPPAPLTRKGKKSNKSRTVIIAVVPSVASAVLIISIGVYSRVKKSIQKREESNKPCPKARPCFRQLFTTSNLRHFKLIPSNIRFPKESVVVSADEKDKEGEEEGNEENIEGGNFQRPITHPSQSTRKGKEKMDDAPQPKKGKVDYVAPKDITPDSLMVLTCKSACNKEVSSSQLFVATPQQTTIDLKEELNTGILSKLPERFSLPLQYLGESLLEKDWEEIKSKTGVEAMRAQLEMLFRTAAFAAHAFNDNVSTLMSFEKKENHLRDQVEKYKSILTSSNKDVIKLMEEKKKLSDEVEQLKHDVEQLKDEGGKLNKKIAHHEIEVQMAAKMAAKSFDQGVSTFIHSVWRNHPEYDLSFLGDKVISLIKSSNNLDSIAFVSDSPTLEIDDDDDDKLNLETLEVSNQGAGHVAQDGNSLTEPAS